MYRLRESIKNPGVFTVVAELVPGRGGRRTAPIARFLEAHQAAKKDDPIPEPFDFAGVAIPQNPGGVSNMDPSDALAALDDPALWEGLSPLPHLSCKDHNKSALASLLTGYRERGILHLLALTGDLPATSKGVFELESVTLLQLISKMNRKALLKSKPEALDKVPRFFPGAAVSPFKYTEGSAMQQYFKMEKKAAAGARFFITQVGWDWRKSEELIRYMREVGLQVPVLGNVYFLTTATPAPRLMHDGKLPGCYVSTPLLKRLREEDFEAHKERAAQQVAMYRALGYDGVDIGGVEDYETFRDILRRAAEIGTDWEAFKDNLYWPPEKAFYLYTPEGKRRPLPPARKTFHQRSFDRMHRLLLDPEHRGYHLLKKTLKAVGADREESLSARAFFAFERTVKHALFDCEECGDCFLPENFGVCTWGGCSKGLANAPCGDANVDGTCGNDPKRVCRGEEIYRAAKAEPGGIERLRRALLPPRNPRLERTSSILNYLFGKDHTMKNALISIGEDIHASIPRHGAVMRKLVEKGPGAYEEESPELEYVRALIENQAAEGADYIAVNLDAFGESDPQIPVEHMRHYVRMVRKWGNGVPICIDSSNDDVLIAGLEEWYATDEPVKQPLINSIKPYTADKMLPLKKQYDFAFIALLMSDDAAVQHSVEDLVAMAHEIFDKAMAHGFKPEEIFFDSTVFPLAIDMPMEPGVPGYTYRAFETIKAIKSDPKFKGVHFSMGISNCCRDLPGRRIGICRAYVQKAMEYGLDAGIVNVAHHYGSKPADPKLVELVEAYAAMDGDPEKTNRAIELMSEFCDSIRNK